MQITESRLILAEAKEVLYEDVKVGDRVIFAMNGSIIDDIDEVVSVENGIEFDNGYSVDRRFSPRILIVGR